MKVVIVGRGDVESHPPSRALARRLAAAGNEVELHGRVERRPWLLPWHRPDVVHPATRGDLSLAEQFAGPRTAVGAPPAWNPDPELDHAWRAPTRLHLSTAPSGPGLLHHVAAASAIDGGHTPTPGRHRGRRIAVVARWSATTPARYLAEAMDRAGIEVVRAEALGWHEGEVDGTVVVESPLPALPVVGRPEAPVLFWAHHGEHHTATQVRLVHHYGADAVLLAHSWHLAAHFPRPVHRFPFGLPLSLVSGGRSWADRDIDVAFVGSGTDGGGAYARRGQLLAELREAFPVERVVITSSLEPGEMAELYSRARVVPNDCGSRHRPITMRVLEAVGAGALLLTDDAPGLDRLLDPASHHAVCGPDVGTQARTLLASAEAPARAADAHEHAIAHHTTDHRVDELVEILSATSRQHPLPTPVRPVDPLLAPIADDLLLDDVLPLGVDDVEEQLPDRIVWGEDRLQRLDDRPLAHVVVVGQGWSGDVRTVARAARRVVVAGAGRDDVVAAALSSSPAARVRSTDASGTVTVDLGTAGYRVDGP